MESPYSTKQVNTLPIILILASLAMIVMFVEIMIVPALPEVARDFPNDTHWISWVLSIYLLVGAVATPLVGRLGDLYGKRKVLLIVMTIYFIALIGCGFSLEISQALLGYHSIFVLLFFRGLQGIGMGMFTLAFGIVRDTFPPEKTPMAIGIVSAMFSVGVSIGLVVGGWITSIGTWTDAFHVATVFFFLLIVATVAMVRDPIVNRVGKLDLPGSLTLGLCVFAFLLALTQGEDWGWTSLKILGLFAVSAVALVAFIWIELRAKEPIVRPKLFENRAFLSSMIVAVFVGLCMFLVFQTLPYFLMTPKPIGFFGLTDTLTVGLYMLPSAIPQLIFGPLGGTWSKRYGSQKVLIVGMGILTIGFITLLFLHSTFWDITISLSIFGAGLGLCMVSMINLVMESCAAHEFGVASGMNTLFRIVGGSIGPVLAAVILAANSIVLHFGPQAVTFYTEQGYLQAWTLGLVFAIIGFLVALILYPRGGRGQCSPTETTPGTE
jgi:MFS family permease